MLLSIVCMWNSSYLTEIWQKKYQNSCVSIADLLSSSQFSAVYIWGVELGSELSRKRRSARATFLHANLSNLLFRLIFFIFFFFSVDSFTSFGRPIYLKNSNSEVLARKFNLGRHTPLGQRTHTQKSGFCYF